MDPLLLFKINQQIKISEKQKEEVLNELEKFNTITELKKHLPSMERKYPFFHSDPAIIMKCISEDYKYDSIKLLLDSFDGGFDNWSFSPLFCLLLEERYDIFELFLKYGFDIDYVYEDDEYPGIKTTIFYALVNKAQKKFEESKSSSITIDIEKAKFLITHRLDVNKIMLIYENKSPHTPLDFIISESFKPGPNNINKDYYELLQFLFHYYTSINFQPIIALIYKGKEKKKISKSTFNKLIKKHIKYLDFDNINQIVCFNIVNCCVKNVIKLVISYLGVDAFVESKFYKIMIEYANFRKRVDFLQLINNIIEAKKIKNIQNDNMKIFDLIKMNRIHEVENILKLHSNVANIRNRDKTPLMFAIQYCNNTTNMVDLLIKYKANKNAVDSWHFTPLHIACQLNSYKNIPKLITETNVNEGNHFFNTPLMISMVNNNDESAIAVLSSHLIDVNIHDNDVITPLTFMIRNNRKNKEIYRLLIKKGAYIKYDQFKNELLSEIIENKVFLECMIDYGFHLLMKNDISNYIRTPLIFSIKEDLSVLTEKLLNCYDDKEDSQINEEDKNGNSFIFSAIESQNETHLKLLINNGKMDINVRKKDSRETPLMILVKHKKYQLVKLLFQRFKEIDVNIVDKNQETPLTFMINDNNKTNNDDNSLQIEILKLLISHGANLYERYQGNTPLILSIEKRQYDYAKIILEKLKLVTDQTNQNGKSVITVMIEHGIDNEEMFNLLFEKGGYIESTSITDLNILSMAEKNQGFIKSIIRNGLILSKTKGQIEPPNKTPVIFFTKHQQLGMVEKLLENGANIDERDEKEEDALTPIFYSVQCNNKDIFLLLLNKYHAKTTIKIGKNSRKTMTLLSFAKKQKVLNPQLDPIFISTLQPKKNSKNFVQNDNSLPNKFEHSNIKNSHNKSINDNNSKINDMLSQKLFRDYSELHIACLNENEEMINLLLEFSYNINEPCCDGSTPLLYSVKNKKIKSIECLLKNNANLLLPDHQGETAISYVLKDLSLDINMKIFCLLIPYLDCNIIYPSENLTPIHYLIKYHKDIKEINNIISNSRRNGHHLETFNINAVDGQGDTPLLYALKKSKKCSIELIETLLSNGANVNCIDRNYYTPLFYAVEKENASELVDLFFKYEANVNYENKDKINVLKLAIKNQNTVVTRKILEYKNKLNKMKK